MTNIEQARAYIQTAALAISGEGGDNTTFKVACKLVHGYALIEDDALRLMGEYNTRLDEQWTWHQLKHKVECALKSLPRYPCGSALVRSGPYKSTPPASPPQVTIWKISRKPLPVEALPAKSVLAHPSSTSSAIL